MTLSVVLGHMFKFGQVHWRRVLCITLYMHYGSCHSFRLEIPLYRHANYYREASRSAVSCRT